MYKKQVSMLLLIIMLLSVVNPVFGAAGDKSANLTWDEEIKQFKEYMGQKQSPLTKPEEVREFREKYWYHLFPEYNRAVPGRKPECAIFNNDSPLSYNIMYYGWMQEVVGNSKDNKGAWLYLGYTLDNRYVSNIMYTATSWRNPQLLNRDDYITGHLEGTKFDGGINPFVTDYNNPKFIGKAYLGENTSDEEADTYGRQILTEWAKKVKQREIGWQDNKEFFAVFNNDLDTFLKYVTITVPPTSRSKGQCLAWFTSDSGRLTHRTFFIDETEEIDFKATRYTWDESTKTLSVFYEVDGLEKIEGDFGSYLISNVNGKDVLIDGYFLQGDVEPSRTRVRDNVIDYEGENSYTILTKAFENEDKWHLLQGAKSFIKNNLNQKEYVVNYDLSFISDERDADIVLTAIINGGHDFPEYKENAYANNSITVEIPATKAAPDLIVDKIAPGTASVKPGAKYNGKVSIRRAPKQGTESEEPINTVLYLSIANGKVVGETDIPVSLKPGESREIPFSWEAGSNKNKNVFIVAEINPEKLGANRLPERTYDNNKKTVTLGMEEEKIDLAVRYENTIDSLYKGQSETAQVRVTNSATKPITTDLVWRFNGSQIRKVSITIPAKGSIVDSCKIKMPSNVKSRARFPVEIEVNPGRNKPPKEVTWANNKISFNVFNLGVDDQDQREGSDPYLTK